MTRIARVDTLHAPYGTNTCCGVLELGSFSTRVYFNDEGEPKSQKRDFRYFGMDAELSEKDREMLMNSARDVLAKLKGQYRNKGMYVAWFVRHANTYIGDNLRRAIMEDPGYIDLGVFKNPNTGNILHGVALRVVPERDPTTFEEIKNERQV